MTKVNLKQGLSVILLCCNLGGMFPFGANKWYNAYKFLLIVLVAVLNVLQMIFLINEKNFELWLSAIYISSTTFWGTTKWVIFSLEYYKIQGVMSKLNEDTFCNTSKKQEECVLMIAVRKCRTITRSFGIVLLVEIFCFNILRPLLSPSEKRTHTLNTWLPEESAKYYVPIQIAQALYCFEISLIILVADMLFCVIMIQIGAQCDFLIKKISSMATVPNQLTLRKNLNHCIEHHKLIIEWAQDCQNSFGKLLHGQIVMSLAALVFALVVSSFDKADSSMALFYAFYILCELFFYCWFGNEVKVKSMKIPEAIYSCAWYNFPEDIKKDLKYFMQRTQYPIVLKVWNVFEMRLGTFISIIKTSWGYKTALVKFRTE